MRMLYAWMLLVCVAMSAQAEAARVLVITDMDDTIKQSNSVGKFVGNIYHFLRKKVYIHTRDLMVDLERFHHKKGDNVEFHYVSAALDFLVAQESWLRKNYFPVGVTYLKKFNSPDTFTFKYQTIAGILEKVKNRYPDEELKIYFFGDNSKVDDAVYLKLTKDYKLNAKIYIRDVAAQATPFDPSTIPVVRLAGANYFFSERELNLEFMNAGLKQRILADLRAQKLIPEYTLKAMKRRFETLKRCESRECKRAAEKLAEKMWNSYHVRAAL